MSHGFPEAAKEALPDAQLRRDLGKATTTIRAKRGARRLAVPTGAPRHQHRLELLIDEPPMSPRALDSVDDGGELSGRRALVSGPSATSDIGLERVGGAHGPRDLVILVEL